MRLIERREGKRKVFPIGLAGSPDLRDGNGFDADHGG
jgi:hypothetical protein